MDRRDPEKGTVGEVSDPTNTPDRAYPHHPPPHVDDDPREMFERYSDDIMVWLDIDLRIEYATTSLSRLIAHVPDPLRGTPFLHLGFSETWRTALRDLLDAVRAHRSPRSLILDHSHDTTSRSWHWNVHPHTSGDGADAKECFVAIARDITETVEHAERLRENERKYRLLVEHQTDLLVKVDANGRFQFVSPSYCRMFGRSEAELLGASFLPLVHEDDRESTRKAVDSLFSPPHRAYIEQRAYTVDGGKWLAWMDTAILNDNGEVEAIVATGRDIEQRKRYQDLLAARMVLSEAARSDSPELLFRRTVDFAEQLTHSTIGFIHHFDTMTDLLRLNTWSSATLDKYCTADAHDTHYPLEQAGVWADAVRQGRPVIHNDYKNLPHRKGYPEGHVEVERELVVPVVRGSKTIGVIGVGNKETDYTTFDLDIVEKLVDFAWDTVEQRQSEVKFRALFSTAYDGVWIVDPAGIIQDVNERYGEMSGYARDEIVGQPISQFDANHDDAGVQARIHDLLAENHLQFETRHRRKDGSEFDVEIAASALQTRPSGLAVFIRDITERKEAERHMRESEERLEALADSSFECLFFSDKGVCVDQNKTAERVFGYTWDEAIGRMGTEWIVPEDRATVLDRMQQDHTEPYEVTALRKDGSTFPCEIQARSSMVRGRRLRVTALRDISERKRAEAELKSLEEQIRHSQKIEAIGLLAGGVAHDFNNLLTPILGNADLVMLKQRDEVRGRQELLDIISAAEKAKDLVKQLLAFGRKQTLTIEPHDQNDLIRDLSKILRRTIREDIQIHYDLTDRTTVIDADRTQIEQVLLNLCINAQDAMPDGGDITLETRIVTLEHPGPPPDELAPGDYVELSVHDTGTGIPAEQLEMVFDPFFTTKEKGKGTGLGLSTVHGIIRQHRGTVSLQSTVGEGTTFRILLPRGQADSLQVEERKTASRGNYVGKQVLLVEDQKEVRVVAERAMQRLGLIVISTGDPLEAVSMVEQDGLMPDLLFTDVVMPGLHGPALAERILNRLPELTVIYASGYSQEVTESRGMDLDEVLFLQKPFTIASLTRILDRAFPE